MSARADAADCVRMMYPSEYCMEGGGRWKVKDVLGQAGRSRQGFGEGMHLGLPGFSREGWNACDDIEFGSPPPTF